MVLSLTACTGTSIDRDGYVKSSLLPPGTSIRITEEALEECLGPSAKPDSRIVSAALAAWQKDRNRLRACAIKNGIKADIIRQIIKEYEQR